MNRIIKALGLSLLISVTAVAGDYVFLNSILKDGNEVRITYGKNFPTCVHLLTTMKKIVHVQNLFCETGLNKTAVRTTADFTVPIAAGQSYQLCHGNNYNVCSAAVGVQELAPSPYAAMPDYDPAWLGPIPTNIDIYSSWGPYLQALRYQAYLEAQAAAFARAGYGGLFANLASQNLASQNLGGYELPNSPQYAYYGGAAPMGGGCRVSVQGGGPLRAVTCERNYTNWLQTLPTGTAISCYNNCLAQVTQ